MNKVVIAFLVVFTTNAYSQSNFTYMPEHPKAGDEIKFTYTTAGDLAQNQKIPEVVVLSMGNKKKKVDEIVLKRNMGKLEGSFKTDSSVSLVAFGFSIDGKFDNNGDSSYIVYLYDGDKIRQGAFINAANLYGGSYDGSILGVSRNTKRSLASYDKEFELYPASKDSNMFNYLLAVIQDDKTKGNTAIQKEIEKRIAKGLQQSDDYDKLSTLYNYVGLRQQATFIKKLKKEKFPNSTLSMDEYYAQMMEANDGKKMEEIYQQFISSSKNSSEKQLYNTYKGAFLSNLIQYYLNQKDWANLKRISALQTDKNDLASIYNSIAWKLQQDSINLPLAEEFASSATNYAKAEWAKPTYPKPDMQTTKQWENNRKNTYSTYADTYAMVLYRLGKYKQALPYAADAALKINNGKNKTLNTTYALVASKGLSPKNYVPALETFVKNGMAEAPVFDILKSNYVKNHESETGFTEYITTFEKEATLKLIAEIKKGIINDPAPQFALNDLKGNKISMADLKGKTVIIDFWATWCGPCIRSLPAMQKMANKYKNDPNVKFLFIDTWQNEENKEKNAADFIAKNNYDIDVLMDNESTVVGQFKVDGIPTKFVIGKDGNIKFKAIGFESDIALEKELNAMIELTN